MKINPEIIENFSDRGRVWVIHNASNNLYTLAFELDPLAISDRGIVCAIENKKLKSNPDDSFDFLNLCKTDAEFNLQIEFDELPLTDPTINVRVVKINEAPDRLEIGMSYNSDSF